MYAPDFADFCHLAREGNLVPVVREVFADLETPVSAFLKIDSGGDAFLLESVEGGEKWGRYSFLGAEPRGVVSSRGGAVTCREAEGTSTTREVPHPFFFLREVLAPLRLVRIPGLPRFVGGLVGYLSYDMARFFERLPERATDDLGFPEQYFLLVDRLLVFDNVAQKIQVIALADLREDGPERAYRKACRRIDEWVDRLRSPLPAPKRPPVSEAPLQVVSNFPPGRYEAAVRRAKEYIRAGDVIQVVLAQRFECPLRVDPFRIYRVLRTLNPSPYMFFLRCGETVLAGASPEVMVRLEGRDITVRPIAGTRPRGTTEIEDEELARELATDPKELAEHVMLLDLGRNDVGRVAEIGSVRVTESFAIERYSHVMHLVSNVTGRLREGADAFDVVRATFPAGTLTGAPKVRAMEIIEELEPVRRGPYGGAVGYFGFDGAMDTCIAIRTLVARGRRVFVGAGAGIVADSVPEREHAECVNKARALVQAVRLAEEAAHDPRDR
ncbi:MAG: anthranilate synthase component I [Candidatus Binatia bacterium]|nr:MAG: anthranilate synthase component I [Candidatus Binatia bacterium]